MRSKQRTPHIYTRRFRVVGDEGVAFQMPEKIAV
jgi:hypothetical protein